MAFDEFDVPVSHVRKEDRIFYNNEWRTVTSSHQYIGPPSDSITWIITVVKTDDWPYDLFPNYGMQPSDDYESPEPYWPRDCVDEIAFTSLDTVVRIYSDKIEVLDKSLTPYRWWVAVFEVDRGYGGSEEGGWWFDIGEVKQVVPVSTYEEAWKIREQLTTLWQSTGNSSSVIYSGGDYSVSICKNFPEDYPSRVPHYS